MAKFQPGQSGNPKGRPKGFANQARLRESIGKEVDAVLAVLAEQAKAGDVTAAKVLLDRVLPPLRPISQAITFTPGATLTETGNTVLTAIASGRIPADVGSGLLQGLDTLARIAKLDELVARIEKLEAGQYGPT